MLSCREVTELISQSQERKLRWREKIGLKLHLMLCQGCRNFQRQMQFLKTACKDFTRKDD